MTITIRIIYRGYAARIMRRGSFSVNTFEFDIDSNQEAARVAYEWVKQIRREAHIEEIIEVVYDQDKDITELVRELEKAPLE
jgi:FAD synthase